MRFITILTTALACATAVFGASVTPAACQSSQSPAYAKTKEAFEGMKNARLYMLAAIINSDPTHAELQEAAKWQLGQVKELVTQASSLNDQDGAFPRHIWYAAKLKWLNVEVAAA